VDFQQDAKERHIHIEGFTAQSYPEDLEKIAEPVDNSFVSPVVSSVLSFEEAKKAEQLYHQ
jgi:hypothetical protein